LISASKITLSHYKLKILRLKVTKKITNLLKKFCEFRPRETHNYENRIFTKILKHSIVWGWKGKDRLILITSLINARV